MNKRQIINQEFERLTEALQMFFNAKEVSESVKNKDGRLTSALLEEHVYEEIEIYYKDNDKVQVRQQQGKKELRNWADFYMTIDNDGEIYDIPVNIKCPTIKKDDFGHWKAGSGDNASSNNSLFWTLFGIGEDWSGSGFWEKVSEITDNYTKDKLIEMINECENDYYYLVVNKSSNNDIFFSSMKQLSEITINANNLPFQIKWGKNREIVVERNNLEAFKILFLPFYEGLSRQKSRFDSADKIYNIFKDFI